MKKMFLAFFFCLFLVVCINPPHDNAFDPENPDKANLAGTVYDGLHNNILLTHGMVILAHMGGAPADTVTIDGSGGYGFDSIDPGIYEINAASSHLMTETFTESLPADTNIDDLDLYASKAIFDLEDESLNTQEPRCFRVMNGTWTVVDDPVQDHVYQGITPGTGLAIAMSDIMLGDFYCDSKIRVDTSSIGFFTGLLFRYRDSLNFYGAMFSVNTLHLIRVSGGTWTAIDSMPHVFSPGTWYTLAVECTGDHIEVYLNYGSAPLINKHDNTIPGGKVGLFAEHLTTVRFDDIYMEKH
jgi:hypothetical protein